MTSQEVVRQRRGWDIALSIVFMVVAVLALIIGLFLQLFAVAFTDSCPPATCNSDLGISEVGIVWSVVGIVLLVSIVMTIVFLVIRRRAWWIALIGLAVVLAGAVLAFALYIAAVGYGA